jgi:hypothetical protein
VQEINKIFSNSVEGQKRYIAPLIYAGIAKYNDKNWSKVLINKYIDDIAKAFVGSPIVEGHNQPISDTDPNILGVVDEVFCNGEGFTLRDGTFIKPDGKYYCGFAPRNGKEQECEEAVKRTGFISTSYLADEVIEPLNGEKFEYINIPYDVEIKSIKPRHVALVKTPRYEEAIIYENKKENIMLEHESKVEIEKGVFVSFVSSAAEKGKELLAGIFDNSKKKKNNSNEKRGWIGDKEDYEELSKEEDNDKKNNMSDKEAKKDLKKLEKHEEEEIKEEKKENSKKKKNNSEDKKDEEKDNSDEEEVENSVEIEGEKVSMTELKNCWKNSKKSNAKIKENSKEEVLKEKISLEEIEAKSFNNSANSKSFKIGVSEFGYNEFFNSKK